MRARAMDNFLHLDIISKRNGTRDRDSLIAGNAGNLSIPGGLFVVLLVVRHLL